LAYVSDAFAQGKQFSEADVRAHLEARYKEEPDFFDLSFPTIPGIGTNSAIIHYSHADSNNVGKDGDFYLLDSGCHYTGGTTDTTRTTVFGTPKADQIEKYTLVLKSHINCANFRFQEGTNGAYIDATARRPMYQAGLDFGHGTGHGVGAFLNVHEGPNRISKANNTVFKPGMVTSIEPGYYEANWGGIRLENLYYVAVDQSLPQYQGKNWLKFEPLTFVPFEKKLIDFSKLNDEELTWLKDYNRKVWDKLSPTLDTTEQAWLKDQTTVPNA
jgi:Xaa-Pro aminopeptidase